MVEHAAVNRGVAGSSPARGAQRQQFICCLFLCDQPVSAVRACTILFTRRDLNSDRSTVKLVN